MSVPFLTSHIAPPQKAGSSKRPKPESATASTVASNDEYSDDEVPQGEMEEIIHSLSLFLVLVLGCYGMFDRKQ